MAFKIKFFYLLYGEMGLLILKYLIKEGLVPDLVISHKSYNIEGNKEFYSGLTKLYEKDNLNIVYTDNIFDYKKEMTEYNFGFCVGFMDILKPEIFNAPKLGIFNLHCGKLPEYRGRAPISRAIINGDEFIYTTIHKIDKGVDSGDILLEKKILIPIEANAKDMYRTCTIKAAYMIKEATVTLNKCIENNSQLKLTKQKETISKPNKSIADNERKIDWNKPTNSIYNLIRGISYPYPMAYFVFENKRYFVNKSYLYDFDINRKTGEVISVSGKVVHVNCTNGSLYLLDIYDENGFVINLESFFKKGNIFE